MCGGYQPDVINHGRILPEVQRYTLDLCSVAEALGVQLHFFFVGNGLDKTYACLRQILDRGHILDSHTYTHLPLITDDVQRLDEELALVNDLFERRLGWHSTVLRGPGGYHDGLAGRTENQRAILKNGFKWVSCQVDRHVRMSDRADVLAVASR